MKLRINNAKNVDVKVVLEPWATEFIVAPGDFVDFIAEGSVPVDAYFQVDENEYGTIVCPEWEGALVYAYDAKGNRID